MISLQNRGNSKLYTYSTTYYGTLDLCAHIATVKRNKFAKYQQLVCVQNRNFHTSNFQESNKTTFSGKL